MKKHFFSLLLSAAIFTTSPLLAMGEPGVVEDHYFSDTNKTYPVSIRRLKEQQHNNPTQNINQIIVGGKRFEVGGLSYLGQLSQKDQDSGILTFATTSKLHPRGINYFNLPTEPFFMIGGYLVRLV